MLENRVVFEAGPSAWRLQIGWGFPDIQPPLDLSFCGQPLAIPAPVDLSALICRQNVACSDADVHIYMYIYIEVYI